MKKIKNSTRNKKLVFKSTSAPVGIEKYLPSKKVEFLDSFKMSLETLLDSIKNCQIDLLSISGKDKNRSIKALLSELIEELVFSLNEKESNVEYLEKMNSKIKIPLQNIIFIENKGKDNNKYSNKKNINISNLKTETELLQMLNFKAENEITQLDNTMSAKFDENEYLNIFLEEPFIEGRINMCIQPKNFPFINKLLQTKLKKKSKKLKLMLSLKKHQNDQIFSINQNIYKLRYMLFFSKIDNNIIIEEESKEYSNNISTNTIFNTNDIIHKNNQMKQNDEDENEDDNVIILKNESNDYSNNSH